MIRKSIGPCVAPILLVQKKNEEWGICVDTRAINKITFKYKFSISRLNDLLDYLHGSKMFSKIDHRSGYHHIRIHEGDEWTFIKPKDLINCWLFPLDCQMHLARLCVMNQTLKHFLGDFVVEFLNDILVYNKSKTEHARHLRQVFEVLVKKTSMDPWKVPTLLSVSVVFGVHHIIAWHSGEWKECLRNQRMVCS